MMWCEHLTHLNLLSAISENQFGPTGRRGYSRVDCRTAADFSACNAPSQLQATREALIGNYAVALAIVYLLMWRSSRTGAARC